MDEVVEEDQLLSQLSNITLFPGFRFSPSDEELISFYLKKKLEGFDKSVKVITELEICKYEPWDLPDKSIVKSDKEWCFFSPRGKKYPKGSKSNRTTEHGFWKATGKERILKAGADIIGTKRTLVFLKGRQPRAQRTEWIMNEYSTHENLQDNLVVCRLRKNLDFRPIDTSGESAQGGRRRRLSPVRKKRNMVSEAGTSETGVWEENNEYEWCPEKSSSSNDSYAIDLINSPSESPMHKQKNVAVSSETGVSDPNKGNSSNDTHSIEQASESQQKLSNDITLPGPSSPPKDSEDDFFAEILKDDIIKLDESSHSAGSTNFRPFVFHDPEAENMFQEPISPPALQFQGTANPRIRLGRGRSNAEGFKIPEPIIEENSEEKDESSKSEKPKCLLTSATVRRPFMFIVVILAMLVVFLSLLGGFLQIKRLTYVTF